MDDYNAEVLSHTEVFPKDVELANQLINEELADTAQEAPAEVSNPEKFTTVKAIQGYTKIAERRPTSGSWRWLVKPDEKAVILYQVYEDEPKKLGLMHRRLGMGSYDLLAFRLPS